MDPAHVQKVKEEHQKGLVNSLQNIRKWTKFKADYEALKQRLETLADKVAYDVMVPFGCHAFMPGKLVHTNDITVLLGEDWFAEVSAKQASQIAERRIKKCDQMLQEFEKEKKQFENWLGYISEVMPNSELVEIIEDYDPEKEKLWREQHSKNVKAYRKKLAEEKRQSKTNESEKVQGEGDNIAEINESFLSKSEFKKSENDSRTADEFPRVDNSLDHSLESYDETTEDTTDNENNSNNNNTEEMYSSVVSEEDESTEDDHHRHHYSKHVRWKDESQSDSKYITFTHSKLKKKSHSHSSKHSKTKKVDDEPAVGIQSPSDIYKCFVNPPQLLKPKSILKHAKVSSLVEVVEPCCITENIDIKKADISSSPAPLITDVALEKSAFTGVVQERVYDDISLSEERNPWKPVSRFKSSRRTSK